MISVTILTKNSERSLAKTLGSVQAFPEVCIGDTGSTDSTLEIAKRYPNVKIFHLHFEGFGKAHNQLSELASNKWILSLDSDEELTEELAEEILSLKLEGPHVYAMMRDNYFNGKHIKGCAGWYPDPVIRLYNKEVTHFSSASVHEKVETAGLELVQLKGHLRHIPYATVSDFLRKIETYSSLFASARAASVDKKAVTFGTALRHGAFAFFKSYLLKRGFLCGKEGFIIAFSQAEMTYYKYLKASFSQR